MYVKEEVDQEEAKRAHVVVSGRGVRGRPLSAEDALSGSLEAASASSLFEALSGALVRSSGFPGVVSLSLCFHPFSRWVMITAVIACTT